MIITAIIRSSTIRYCGPVFNSFDPLNRLIQSTDHYGGLTTTSYNAQGHVSQVVAPNGATTTYTYNGFGDLTQTYSPDSNNDLYFYDKVGNVTTHYDGSFAATLKTFDALNRVVTQTYPADTAENITYTYDQGSFGIGHLTTLQDATGTTHLTYDEQGHLLSEAQTRGTVALTTGYTYDTAGRLAQLTYPSGVTASYVHDAAGRVITVNAHMPGATSSVALASGIDYLPFGPLDTISFANGSTESRSFDLDYRIGETVTTGVTTAQDLSYAYDDGDNVSSITDNVNSANSQIYTYDAMDRLLTATGTGTSLTYTYDSVGNRLSASSGGTTSSTYQYQANSNRLVFVTTGSSVQTIVHTYAGSVSSIQTGSSPATTLTYNQAGRLTQVSNNGVTQIQNVYDAYGHRTVKLPAGVASAAENLVYSHDGRLLETTDNTGFNATDTFWLGGRPLATYSPVTGNLFFLVVDRQNTPQLMTDTSQNVVWQASYQPFGNTTASVATDPQILRFPGQIIDPETGWYQNGMRDYNPNWGRYLESDPIGLNGGINTYGYAEGRPVNLTDSTGLKGNAAQYAASVSSAYLEGEAIAAAGGGSPPADLVGAFVAMAQICVAGGTFDQEEKDRSGIARIYQYRTDSGLAPHFSVEVVLSDGSTIDTHQVRDDQIKDSFVETVDSYTPPLVPIDGKTRTYYLPDAQSAFDYSQYMIGQPLGVYNIYTNSCLTWCADVLRHGGAPIPDTFFKQLNWFNNNVIPPK